MAQDFECRISVNLLLEVADRLYSFDKVPLAKVIIYVILEQLPEHQNARKLYQTITGEAAPTHPVTRNYRVYRDSETDMVIVADKAGGGTISFNTFAEAEAYVRGGVES